MKIQVQTNAIIPNVFVKIIFKPFFISILVSMTFALKCLTNVNTKNHPTFHDLLFLETLIEDLFHQAIMDYDERLILLSYFPTPRSILIACIRQNFYFAYRQTACFINCTHSSVEVIHFFVLYLRKLYSHCQQSNSENSTLSSPDREKNAIAILLI
ncbi:hypothetical protein BpHYR1_026786 [Brachionus plicatilis]|uniref:Uncharacterized protein n=1 Tax=Brachionus plicatilis TaxID=10195 RepID=A0A3M7QZV0_BRAPC|nr:hypothetical protein BpHYR1_026786 [Brachionus plicatilis]